MWLPGVLNSISVTSSPPPARKRPLLLRPSFYYPSVTLHPSINVFFPVPACRHTYLICAKASRCQANDTAG